MQEKLTLFRQENALGWTEAAFYAPDPRLRPFVERAYLGWTEHVARPAIMRETPVPMIPMIFNLGPAWRLAAPGRPAFRADSFLSGLDEHYTLVESTGRCCCMQVNFTPIGAARLLGQPLHAIAQRVVAIDDVLAAAGRDLIVRLRDAPDWRTRFVMLEQFFLARFADNDATSREAAWAWDRLRAHDGLLPIADLVTELGWSHKRLIAVFHEQFGLTPKRAARVMRFGRAVRSLDGAPTPRWAEIAADCGYYDQAHLNRDFREFAGVTPGEFFAGRLPNYSVPGY